MKRILIFGRSGQISNSLVDLLPTSETQIFRPERQEADFLRAESVCAYLEKTKPDLIINAAAYTAVDKAETERAEAEKINSITPAAIAKWCAGNGRPLIHFSTDYVFPGTGNLGWTEIQPTQTLNWYGETKLRGDLAIAESRCHFLNFRVSWVYSHEGKNFVKTILRLAGEKEKLSIVNDQMGYPSYSDDIAASIVRILPKISEAKFNAWGAYHLTGKDSTSWHGFAEEIVKIAQELRFPVKVGEIRGIPTSEYPTPAKRPLNSRLDGTKFQKQFGFQLPLWTESLHRCMEKMNANQIAEHPRN